MILCGVSKISCSKKLFLTLKLKDTLVSLRRQSVRGNTKTGSYNTDTFCLSKNQTSCSVEKKFRLQVAAPVFRLQVNTSITFLPLVTVQTRKEIRV